MHVTGVAVGAYVDERMFLWGITMLQYYVQDFVRSIIDQDDYFKMIF